MDYFKALRILDVGSYQADPKHETYRSLCEEKKLWSYFGLDLHKGANVDIVSCHPYRWPMGSLTFDVVISGQTLEHVAHPHTWMDEIYRILKYPGKVCIIVPSSGKVHHRPDYWRILPDGMAQLLSDACFTSVEVICSNKSPWIDVIGKGEKCM